MGTPEHDLERERIACVFGLGGSELHEADDRFPDSEGWDGPEGIAYWYEGAPEYVSPSDLGLDLDSCGEVRTAIVCCTFGHPSPPEGWEQVATFSSSGEAPCWCCGAGTAHDDEGDKDDDDTEGCKLCNGDGLIYLGDGWHEIVYCWVE